MFSTIGFVGAAVGLFLFLWYRTVAGLPSRRRPQYLGHALFKWGMPAVSLLAFISGIIILAKASRALAAMGLGISGILGFLVIKFDRYSATMRVIYDHYGRVLQADPDGDEEAALFQTAAWRYPDWSHDRLAELAAGKNIQELVLLMILNEFGVNPITDWQLYQTLRAKVSRIVRPGR